MSYHIANFKRNHSMSQVLWLKDSCNILQKLFMASTPQVTSIFTFRYKENSELDYYSKQTRGEGEIWRGQRPTLVIASFPFWVEKANFLLQIKAKSIHTSIVMLPVEVVAKFHFIWTHKTCITIYRSIPSYPYTIDSL